MTVPARTRNRGTTADAERWDLTLYVSGASPRSTVALEAVRRLCDEDLPDRVDLQVIDAHDHPALAERDEILALPTLVKRRPGPLRRLAGEDLADHRRVRAALGLPTSRAAPVRGPS